MNSMTVGTGAEAHFWASLGSFRPMGADPVRLEGRDVPGCGTALSAPPGQGTAIPLPVRREPPAAAASVLVLWAGDLDFGPKFGRRFARLSFDASGGESALPIALKEEERYDQGHNRDERSGDDVGKERLGTTAAGRACRLPLCQAHGQGIQV